MTKDFKDVLETIATEVILFLCIILISYIFGSFLAGSFNIADWEKDIRQAIVGIDIAVYFFIGLIRIAI